jgi:hypothetical protein
VLAAGIICAGLLYIVDADVETLVQMLILN